MHPFYKNLAKHYWLVTRQIPQGEACFIHLYTQSLAQCLVRSRHLLNIGQMKKINEWLQWKNVSILHELSMFFLFYLTKAEKNIYEQKRKMEREREMITRKQIIKTSLCGTFTMCLTKISVSVNLFKPLKNLWHRFCCFAHLLIYKWENWDAESISGFPKIRQLTSKV